MRLLQLVIGDGQMLDLHPNVSVVTGLGEVEHASLVEAVVRLARAEATEGTGLLEAHGILFDLDPALLGVLEPRSNELDPVVRPGHLPSHVASNETRALRANEHRLSELLGSITDLMERRATMHDAVEAAEAAVEALRAQRRDAESGIRTRQQRLDELTSQQATLDARRLRIDAERAEISPQLASARSDRAAVEDRTAAVRAAAEDATALRVSVEEELALLDPISRHDAQIELDQARARLAAVEAEVEAERVEDAERERERAMAEAQAASTARHDPQEEPAAVRLERLDQRVQELEQLLLVLTPVRRGAVEKARAQLAGGDGISLVSSPEANRMADELDRVGARLAEFEPGPGASTREVSPAEARARLDEARQSLLDAEGALRTPDLDPDLVARLEAVHAELVDALERSGARFWRGAKRATPIDELRETEADLLDQLGFASYSTYLMGYPIARADPQLAEALRVARAELAEAEQTWRVLEQETEAALAHAALLDERRRLLEAARQLLGQVASDGSPQAALRNLMVPAVPAQESARVLHDLLEVVGLDLGDEDLEPEDLLLIADAWLDEVDQVDDRRVSAMDELAALQLERAELVAAAELEAVEATVAAAPNPERPGEQDREGRRLARVAEATQALSDAEQRAAGAEATAARRGVLLDDLAAAQDMERSAIEQAADAAREMAAAEATEAPLVARLAELEAEWERCGDELADIQAGLDALREPAVDPGALDAELAMAEAMARDASEAIDVVQASLASMEAERDALTTENERLRSVIATEAPADATPASELEWYLLARLASQRSVSMGGSAPLLLDDALRGLDAQDVGFLLSRLERMTDAVQLIVVSDDPVVLSWATNAGIERAAIVSLQPC